MSSENHFEALQGSSFLSGSNANYIDELYEAFLREPQSVPQEWQTFFSGLPKTNGLSRDVSHAAVRSELLQKLGDRGIFQAVTVPQDGAGRSITSQEKKQGHVFSLMNAYRSHGHHHAKLDPLNLSERRPIPDLSLDYHQLSPADLDQTFSTESRLTENGAALRDILERLERTYCDTIGAEYMHISDAEQVQWLQKRLESAQGHFNFSGEQKQRFLRGLVAAEGLERYLGTKYVGQKRFSIEGADALLPMLYELAHSAIQQEVAEVVIGMAHRGRLNVLVNLLGQSPSELFSEFEGNYTLSDRSGDVKYHKGFSSDIVTPEGELHLTLAFNPSHLEIINPVVEGSVRARQRRRIDQTKDKVVPVLVHGDAAFSGQGVVMETLSFSQARGYATGGTVHVVVNNQIGFTTSNPLDARSTLYCTDVAKMVQAPVLHVNGNDPEACVFAILLAFDFRMRFKRDIVVDLICYRRHGHNEADEPSITQPMMYAAIRDLPTPLDIYAKRLQEENLLTDAQLSEMVEQYRQALQVGKSLVQLNEQGYSSTLVANWNPFLNQDWRKAVKTGVPLETIQVLSDRMDIVPEGFTPHPQIAKLLQERQKMTRGELPINWGYAENLAYASLLDEKYFIRLSGQDCGRGTFAHRHAILYDYKNGEPYVPLKQFATAYEQLAIIDSILSEEAVLGFEYGFATTDPYGLVIWEAQFGDFANGAQVVIDQFISSGEQKWGRLCGLVMLLPHGYEGQGPEHSSARLERYMQLCAQHNIQVCVPTTPAQCFHMIRRQVLRPYRKPLIVMTPKSLLRHKLAVSTLEDLVDGHFQCLIPEVGALPEKKVKRVALCSGKVYYDLLQKRHELGSDDVALIRIEQLYPFPEEELRAELERYKQAKEVIWCQEEPQNQGAWYAIAHHLQACLSKQQQLFYRGRVSSAAPATGSIKLHTEEQKALVDSVFA